ncbi:MAG: hypothetical protein HOP11_14605 [Saprospiraceae bacterium]|nr:hypothetical protein [Saprospiraceae bacterium]
MKILKYLLFLILGLYLVGFILPSKMHVERSLKTKADPAQIFPFVNDLKNWGQWDPWIQKDPNMKTEYRATTSGVGGGYKWTSNHKEVGNGEMEITESVDNEKIATKMNFGDQGSASGLFALKKEADGTKMTWSMDSDNSTMSLFSRPIGNYMNFMMDGWIGAEFEKGLANLSKIAEAAPMPAAGKIIETIMSEVKDIHVIQIESSCALTAVGEKLGELYGRISKKIEENKLTVAGAPMAMYPDYKPGDTNTKLIAMMPTTAKCTKQCDADMKCYTIPASKVVKCTYQGPYEGNNVAYGAIKKYIDDNKLQAAGEPWEAYTNDPEEVKDPSKFETVVYWPVK